MSCFKCAISYSRTNMVLGHGNAQSGLMILGEAPGHTEDKIGVPFVGRAGKYLTSMLEKYNLTREDYYITNIIKCRPPRNRTPLPEEIVNCRYNLVEELKLCRPKIIFTLGKTALGSLFSNQYNMSVTKFRGREILYVDRILLIPTWHPSFVMQNKEHEQEFINDIELLVHNYKLIINPYL